MVNSQIKMGGVKVVCDVAEETIDRRAVMVEKEKDG